MYNDGGSPTVIDCNFAWNQGGDGGGVFNGGGSNVRMVGCKFVSNNADIYGGGAYNYESSPVLINCTFSGNSCCGFGYCFRFCAGAGVCNIESDCTIINCTFEGNWLNSMYSNRGGGVYSYKGELTLDNCTFSENRAVSFKTGFATDYAGGGVYSVYVVDGSVVNCTFVGNLANSGGGIFNNSKNLKVTNCTFMENSAKHFDGGAVYSGGSPTFSDCSFINNSAKRDGGGVYNRYGSDLMLTNCAFADNLAGSDGGGFCDERSRGTEVTDCTFSGNMADTGGGIFNDSKSMKVTNCTFMENGANGSDGGAVYNGDSAAFSDCSFINNSAKLDGGGVHNRYGSALMLTNCVFADNLAGLNGGGFCDYRSRGTEVINCIFSGNSAELAGGGMYNESHIPNLVNCTFWGNSAVSSGGAMYNKYTYGGISARLTNCYMGLPLITYCDVEGGWRGEGNIDADPCFVEPEYWADVNDPNIIVEPNDPNAVWVEGDYHLLADSPCINAGDPDYIAEPNETDLDGLPRVIGGRIDMGAYEFNHIPVADAGPNQTVYAWIDGIAEVTLDGSGSYDPDGQPLGYLWSWTVDGNTITKISGDGDGIINFLDFAVFAAQYPHQQTENPLLRLPIMAEAWLTNPSSPNWNPQWDIEPTSAIVTIELPIGQHIIELIVNDGIDDSEPDYADVNVVAALEADVWMLPRVINRSSRMPSIMGFVRLPQGVSKNQIDCDELLMLYPAGSDEGIEAIRQFIIQSRRRRNSHTYIFAFFDKAELMDAVPDNGRVELEVVGRLKTGQYFYGSDTVRIIRPRRRWWRHWRRWR
jgi:predicted outer membrane repeat protein